MENYEIIITGIYDSKTSDFLIQNKITSLGFDFRPRSLNFLQQHLFLEIINKLSNTRNRYYLKFADETETGVLSTLNALKNEFDKASLEQKFILEFSDIKEVSYYDKFNHPYIWHFHPMADMKEMFQSTKLRGIVFDHSILEQYHLRGTLYNFLQNFYSVLNKIQKNDLKVYLNLTWESNLISSMLDFFRIDGAFVSIDSSIEAGYRNINLQSLSKNLSTVYSKFSIGSNHQNKSNNSFIA